MLEDLPKQFSSHVMGVVKKNGGYYMEAVIEACEVFNIEPQVAGKFLDKPIVEKIQAEGESMNLLPRSQKLPFSP